MSRFTKGALESATVHLTGQSRAFLLQLESARHEIGRLQDQRAAGLVEAIGLTLREPARPGTLRHVERAASELLRVLREDDT